MEQLYQVVKGHVVRGEKTGILCTKHTVKEAVKLAIKKDQYLGSLVKVAEVNYKEFIEDVGDEVVIEVITICGEKFILNWGLARAIVLN